MTVQLRKQQVEIIDEIENMNDHTILIQAETGIGKSYIPFYSFKESKKWIVTSNTDLTKQYMDDFPCLKEIKGAANYKCNKVKSQGCISCKKICNSNCKNYEKLPNCDLCNKERRCPNCHYEVAKKNCFQSKYCIMNSKFFWTYNVYVKENKHLRGGVLFIDEGHELMNDLRSIYNIELKGKLENLFYVDEDVFYGYKNKDIQRNYVRKILHDNENIDFITMKEKYLKYYYEEILKTKYDKDKDKETIQKLYIKMVTRLNFLIRNIRDKIIVPIFKKDKTHFIVINTDLIFKQIIRIFNQFDKVIIMSGSFNLKLFEDCRFFKYGLVTKRNDFLLENRRIITHGMLVQSQQTYKANLPVLARRIELELAKGLNTIVHAVSYPRAKDLAKLINYPCLIHTSKNRAEIIEKFKQEGGCLISPSIFTGVDFKDDEARINIIAKIPYFPQELTNDLYYLFNDLEASDVMQKVVQGYGRCSRSKEDYQEVLILDTIPQYWFGMINKYYPYFYEALEDHKRRSNVLEDKYIINGDN